MANLSAIARRRFDLAIDLFGNPRTAFTTWLTGASIRVGGDFRGRGNCTTFAFPPPTELNAIDFHWRSLEALGIEKGDNRTEIFISEQEKNWAREFLEALALDSSRPIVGLHPGATWLNKRWPEKHFAALARELCANNVQVLITQGPGEEPVAMEVMRQISPPPPGRAAQIVLLPVLDLRQLASVLQQMQVFVANDCGVMHLSVAVGTTTIGLFGPSQPHIWFPYSPAGGHLAMWHEIECRPCHKNFCPLGHLDCQNKLIPKRMITETLKRLRNSTQIKNSHR
jgi:ADP-heptose:LPS heptosyltransferase